MNVVGQSEEHEFQPSGRFNPPVVFADIEDWEVCWQPVVVADYPHPIQACWLAKNHPIHVSPPPEDRAY